jgi:hypothetical protein
MALIDRNERIRSIRSGVFARPGPLAFLPPLYQDEPTADRSALECPRTRRLAGGQG